jgi:hypothetical protein
MSSDPPVQGPVEEPLAHQSADQHRRKRVRKKASRRKRALGRVWLIAVLALAMIGVMLLLWYFLADLLG